jgi:rhodanese-related sulfurtransferase
VVIWFASSPPDGFVTFFLNHWYLFLAAAVSGALLLWPMLRGGTSAGQLSPATAVNTINRDKGVLIDVSEPAEYASGHAGGSKNVPFGSLESSTELPKNKSLPLLLLCPTGARANRAVAILKKRGYENTRAIGGGVAAWRDANLPMERSV